MVNSHTKNQGQRTNGLAVRLLTDTQTDTQKDGSDSDLDHVPREVIKMVHPYNPPRPVPIVKGPTASNP